MLSCQQACKGEGKCRSMRKMRGNRERMLKGKAKRSRSQLITNESENRKRPDEGDARTGEGLVLMNHERGKKESGQDGRDAPGLIWGLKLIHLHRESIPFPGGRQQTT
jgi:hypothetical protein